MAARGVLKSKLTRSDWSLAKVESAKRIAKEILDGGAEPLKPKARLKRCLAEMKRLQQCESSDDRLMLFIFSVSALLHQARFGGLTDTELGKISRLSHDLLQLEGINSTGTQLSHLYGYVHSALGQIYWQNGQHWSSVWEQYMALRGATVASEKRDGFHFFVMANRLFRLGEVRKAIRIYDEAIAKGLDRDTQERCWSSLLKARRLLGDLEGFSRLVTSVQAQGPLGVALKRDVLWEQECLKYRSSMDLRPMMLHLRRAESASSPFFVAEMILWTHAHPRLDGLVHAPSANHAKKSLSSRTQSQKLLLEVCEVLQLTYDRQSAIELRIERLGESLHHIPKLTLVDHELLAWLAAARALFRLRLNDNALAAACLSQYEALSRRISQGASDDALGIARDMLDGDWYKAGF